MGEKNQGLQFGLRKLLLWTAVAALYLGIIKMLELWFDECVFLVSWIIILGIIRTATNAITTAVVSVVAAGILLLHSFSFDTLVLHVVTPFNLLLVFGDACYWGVLFFGVVEVPFRAVHWVDKLMETKSDGETRGD